MAERVTLKDVAQAAGVAPATASHALSGTGTVSAQTTAHVRRVASQLGYRRDMIAANLRRRQTSTIGVLVPDLSNPYFSELVEALEVTARREGYSLLEGTSNYDPALENHYIDLFLGRRCDGVIVIMGRENVDDIVDAGIPMVAINSHTTENCAFPTIEVKDREGVYEGVTHLVQLGHRRIGLVTFSGVGLRNEGYRQALEYAGVPYDDRLVNSTNRADWQEAATSAERLLVEFPGITALMVTSDISAIGVMQRAHRMGRRIPDDLAVVGFDGINLARALVPSLTTVAQPIMHIAARAMDMIVGQISDGGGPHECPRVLLDTQLIIRESCGASDRSVHSVRTAYESEQRSAV